MKNQINSYARTHARLHPQHTTISTEIPFQIKNTISLAHAYILRKNHFERSMIFLSIMFGICMNTPEIDVSFLIVQPRDSFANRLLYVRIYLYFWFSSIFPSILHHFEKSFFVLEIFVCVKFCDHIHEHVQE